MLTGSAFGLDATAAVTVTAEVLNQIVVSSSANSIPNGLSATLSATGHFSTGARDVTAHVVFQAAPSNVFSVSGSTVTANAMGAFPQSAAITAAYLGVTSAPLALVATSPLLVSLAISPTSPSTLAVGASRAYTALATYSDGSTQDVTSGAVWNSTAPSVLTVNANGLATGASEGSALLSADYQGVHATPLTIVVDRVPTAVYVNCTTPGYPGDPMDPSTLGGLRCLPSAYGYQVMCTASAYYAGVGSTDVTATAVFSSTNGTVATVSSLGTQNGLPVRWISVVGVGTSAIQATYQGVTSTSGGALGSASWVLEGGDVELSFLGVGTLGTPNTTVGQVIDFYVMGLFLGQPPCDLPYSRDMFRQATWTSSNQAVAGDPVMGRMTAVGPGTTTIDAIIGMMWGDIISTVSP